MANKPEDRSSAAGATMHLRFEGPFQWITPDPLRSVLEAPQSNSPGIYLWTSHCVDGYLVSYVGETGRDFRTRMQEHLRDQLAGMYSIRDPEAFCSGCNVIVWRGLWGNLAEPGGLAEYVTRLPELVQALVGFVHAIHFHLASTTCDTRLRRRMEGALAASFLAQGGQVAAFLEEGVRFYPRLSHEEPVAVACSSAAPILGLPSQFEA
jgi:hypothetical protein